MIEIHVVMRGITKASTETTFKQIVPIDLCQIFKGTSLLPSVTHISAQTGPWNAPGQTRTVHLSDKTAVTEKLLEVQPPDSFSYRISGFGGLFGIFVAEAFGTWKFHRIPYGTFISWTYTFVPKSSMTAPFLKAIAHFLWRPYMQDAFTKSVEEIDRAATAAM